MKFRHGQIVRVERGGLGAYGIITAGGTIKGLLKGDTVGLWNREFVSHSGADYIKNDEIYEVQLGTEAGGTGEIILCYGNQLMKIPEEWEYNGHV